MKVLRGTVTDVVLVNTEEELIIISEYLSESEGYSHGEYSGLGFMNLDHSYKKPKLITVE